MISQLRGPIIQKGESHVVIEVGGVGFHVHMPAPFAEEACMMQGEVIIHTHMVVREDGIALYGFLRSQELEMFRLLITVNRVGPAMALQILSQMSVSDLAAAVIGEDEKALTRISGIGKKNAGRIILELRDRMRKKADLLVAEMPRGKDPLREDAESALLALGFSRRESGDAVGAAISAMESPEIQVVIKAALMYLRER